jgi:hypothetical protein
MALKSFYLQTPEFSLQALRGSHRACAVCFISLSASGNEIFLNVFIPLKTLLVSPPKLNDKFTSQE